ncbi:hypothetical protein [Paraburkholderia antibiotica]|uniref:hypothetical protein n=1 Tax=Paraburkholderia antibiotica TaxID=2728839 RepID=UPI001E53690C|nr:hypothetical protein [Paraburkholderia antibiotica]
MRQIFEAHMRCGQRPQNDKRHIEKTRNQTVQARYCFSVLSEIRRVHSCFPALIFDVKRFVDRLRVYPR